ncbi:MAG: hypothetical protein ABIF88_00400 [archaeon]
MKSLEALGEDYAMAKPLRIKNLKIFANGVDKYLEESSGGQRTD